MGIIFVWIDVFDYFFRDKFPNLSGIIGQIFLFLTGPQTGPGWPESGLALSVGQNRQNEVSYLHKGFGLFSKI